LVAWPPWAQPDDAADVPAGWYPDPDQPQTQRYWDGSDWTNQHAPLAETRNTGAAIAVTPSLALVGFGALIAIIGCFLPLAETEGSIPLVGNSMIQHWEGVMVVVWAVAAILNALRARPRWQLYTFIAGAVILGVAVLAGVHLPIEYRNALSEEVAGKASPGTGVWAVGVGGGLIMLAALAGVGSPARGEGRS
jgi:Protein of unknown function (DUF2510)